MSTGATSRTGTSASTTVLWAVRVFAVLAALSILWQGFSASNVIISVTRRWVRTRPARSSRT